MKPQNDIILIIFSVLMDCYARFLENVVSLSPERKIGFMEEIRIYHSIRKNFAMMAMSFAFVAMGIFYLLNGDNTFVVWAGILFFGICGFCFAFLMLRERIHHKPFCIITNESVIMDSGMKKWEVRFER